MTKPNPGPGEGSTASLAADLRAVFGVLRRRLREQADVGDLTPSQTAVLLRLEKDGPSTVSALSRAEGVRSQSMGATVDALETAGLVTGEPDPNDGRQTILSLTEMCRQRILAGRAAREDWLTRTIAANLNAEEQRALARAVVLLRRVANS